MAPPYPKPPPSESPLYHHRLLSPTANVLVSPLCLGTMNFGEAHAARMGECSKETSFEILDRFYIAGGNFIDTANAYQDQENEGNRDEIVLATKYSSPQLLHDKSKIQSNFGGNGAKSLKISVENSLKNLQTTYIDLLYLHWWDYASSIPELMQSLNCLVVAGKVIYLGISDCPAWVVAKANQYARDHGLRQFSVYQGMWNASLRDFERDIIPMCKDEGMAMLPYGTLGQGKFQTEAGYKEREESNPGRKGVVSGKYKAVAKVLEGIAKNKGSVITSVAMAYVMQKAPFVFPLIGCRKVEHLKGSIEALKLYLSDEQIIAIDGAYDFDPGFPHTFLSGTLFGDQDQDVPHGAKDVWLTGIRGTFDYVDEPKAIKPFRI